MRLDVDADARAALLAGVASGFGFSGALDVAIFHLVLQWHHFVMASEITRMLRVDGWLLAILLAVALAGTVLLWRAARAATPGGGLGRIATGGGLLGAALFNGVDILVDHFLLELHRLNETVDSLYPDLAWLAMSALLAVAGWILVRSGLHRRARPAVTPRPRRP